MNLITAMIMRNEASEEKYLKEVLTEAHKYSDKIVILDDNSTDDSIEVAEKLKCKVYTHEEEPLFMKQEHRLREHLWRNILPQEAEQGDFILALDCDEIMGEQFTHSKDQILSQEDVGTYTVQIWEAWGNKNKIRVDGTWNPLGKHTPILTRFEPSVGYQFPKIGLHCGRIPMNSVKPLIPSGCSLLHLGWADSTKHQAKHDFYVENDPQPHPTMQLHYDSMLREPTLVDWWL
jgi:hypothetical protein